MLRAVAAVLVLCGACRLHFDDVASDAATPAGDVAGDASGDAPPETSPIVVVTGVPAHLGNTNAIGYSITVPDVVNPFLIVNVHLGGLCTEVMPAVTGVLLGSASLTQIAIVTGVPCGATAAASSQWFLLDPTPGTHQITVNLAAQVQTIHSTAIVLANVARTTPIRATQTAEGADLTSAVTVASAPGDLVVDAVGQGDGIVGPGLGQTSLFIQNASVNDTLDNSALGTSPGAASVTATWNFTLSDEWQAIATSLRPAP